MPNSIRHRQHLLHPDQPRTLIGLGPDDGGRPVAACSASTLAVGGVRSALWLEVRPRNIRGARVEPGLIRSLSRDAVLYDNNDYEHHRNMAPCIARTTMLTRSAPERIAAHMLCLLRQRRLRQRPHATLDAWLFSMLHYVPPCVFYRRFRVVNRPQHCCWGRSGAAPLPGTAAKHLHPLR